MLYKINQREQNTPSSFVPRFLSIYLFITALPFPINYLPYINIVSKWYSSFWDYFISWIGKTILHVPFNLVSTANGSGDTTYNYVKILVIAILSIVVATLTFIKSINQENNTHFIFYLLRVYLRYWFAITLIKYGIDKVIKVQFPFPYSSLRTTYGDSSPMQLMWNFMGYSTAYNFFSGSIEIVIGALALFRKTAFLGVFLSVAVLTNIVVLNFCYDVPVKLFASTLLISAFFLLSPDAKKLIGFFINNKNTPVAIAPNLMFLNDSIRPLIIVGKRFVLICVLYSIISHSRYRYFATGDGSFKKTYLFGIYSVKDLATKNEVALKNSIQNQWKTVSFLSPNQAIIEYTGGATTKYSYESDTVRRTIKLTSAIDTTIKFVMNYTLQSSNQIKMIGRYHDSSFSVMLERMPFEKYELINRKFQWINEAPYK